jgi:predicted nucleic acid-binding protein
MAGHDRADTNLVAYLLIGGPFTQSAQQVLLRDKVWIAPPFWKHEFLNVLATAVREKMIDSSRAFAILDESRLYVEPRDHDRPREVLLLSAENRIATYDCEFVVLARKLGTRLVTVDKPLLKKFPDVAVSIDDFAAGK